MTIAVSCMPSLAKLWRVKFADTGLYRNIQSLLSFVRRHDTSKSSFGVDGDSPLGAGSTTRLQRGIGQIEIRDNRSNEGQLEFGGIYKMTTVQIKSTQTAPSLNTTDLLE